MNEFWSSAANARFGNLNALRDEAVAATSMDAPTLGLSIVDGLLIPLAFLHLFVEGEAKTNVAMAGVDAVSALVDEYSTPAIAGLSAAAKHLGVPGVAAPATDAAIDIFLQHLMPDEPFIERFAALMDDKTEAFANLGQRKLALIETAGALNHTLNNLFWYRSLRRNRWRTTAGETPMSSLMADALKHIPMLDEPPAPAFGEEVLLRVSRGDGLLTIAQLSWNACLESADGTLPTPGYIRDGRYVGLYFVDAGPGFGPEARLRCFEPFYRGADIQSTYRGARVGLGLTLARIMADRLGGKLEFGSVGRGERPVLFLPVGPASTISIAT